MKILALGPNSTKFCIHNLWASRELEMQKLGAGVWCGIGVRVWGAGGPRWNGGRGRGGGRGRCGGGMGLGRGEGLGS